MMTDVHLTSDPAADIRRTAELVVETTTNNVDLDLHPAKTTPPRPSATTIEMAMRPTITGATNADRACVIPKGLTFIGEATYPFDVRIQGSVQGDISTSASRKVTVELEATFRGSIEATNVQIDGNAEGEITAANGLANFGPQSVFKGTVNYGRLKINEGAEVEATMKKQPSQL
jgi:cytoskeletal protein CcmA (bactofilin family)